MPTNIAHAPPIQLVDFVKRQVRDLRHRGRTERRTVLRNLLVVPVTVQPVDADFRPSAEPFTIISRDISPQGAGLVHSERIDDELLALQMQVANEVVRFVSSVRWCEPIGPFYHIGVKFMAKLTELPTWNGGSTGESSEGAI